jgi:hypothetical protein
MTNNPIGWVFQEWDCKRAFGDHMFYLCSTQVQ